MSPSRHSTTSAPPIYDSYPKYSGHSRMLYLHSVDAESRFFKAFGRRYAIRAAKFEPDTDISLRVARTARLGISVPEKRGAIEGPIRISLCSALFLVNGLPLPRISSNSLRLRSELFSIPTA